MKTEYEIYSQTVDLTVMIALDRGLVVPHRYATSYSGDTDDPDYNRVIYNFWLLACKCQELITGTEIADVVESVEEEIKEGNPPLFKGE